MLRFYELQDGNIYIDNMDVKDINLLNLRKQVAIVPQDIALFSGTIYDNILYGRLDATEEEVIQAAKLANAHNFIMGLENGYKTESGERGTQLSGGQRQRIAIARALLRDPKILLLDEATSALDNESELLIQDSIYNLIKGKTTFIIAHRLSTIMNCDRIFVIDKGCIVEEGNHEQLFSNEESIYKKLYMMQLFEERKTLATDNYEPVE